MTLYHLIDLPCDGRNYTVVVSEKWLLLQNRQCYYPPTEEKVKLMKLLRDHCPPDPITWPLYNNIVDRTRPYGKYYSYSLYFECKFELKTIRVISWGKSVEC